MVDASEAYRRGEEALGSRAYRKALSAFLVVAEARPDLLLAQLRIADTLLDLARPEAEPIYRAVAWRALRTGDPLLGMVAAKMHLALRPSAREIIEVAAALYSAGSDRLGARRPGRPDFAGRIDAAGSPSLGLDLPALIERAVEVVVEGPEPEAAASLPRVPLLSDLPEDVFGAILEAFRLRRRKAGERIIEVGDSADSLFLISTGLLRVLKPVEGRPQILARLGPGMMFGEMAILAEGRRSASVEAETAVDLLELPKDDLAGREHAGLTAALERFRRGRLLANLAATSPFFRALPREERRAVMGLFEPRPVFRGDIVIEEGEAARGLFLVVRGRFIVESGQAQHHLGELGPSDVFGEISLLTKGPTKATVRAVEEGEVLVLDAASFEAVLSRYPEVQHRLETLGVERLRARRERFMSETTGDFPRILV